MLAMRRRMRDHGAAVLQQFGEDFLPLILLFAISVTGIDADRQLLVDERATGMTFWRSCTRSP